MLIMVILILLVPAMISVLLYERFKGYELTWVKRIELLLILAFLINLGTYAIFWLRGLELIYWTMNGDAAINVTGFAVQYMAISLVGSAVLAYILSLVRIEKSRPEKNDASEGADAAVEEASDT